MFIGEYVYSIDEKKRLAVPVKFRKNLGEIAIVTRGLEECLFLYPQSEWKKLVDKLKKLPLSQSDARGFVRLMLSGAMEITIDGLGRILIPDYLKEYAKLKKRVVLTGVLNRIEIWDEDKWKEYKEKTEKEIGSIAERLKDLQI